MSDNVIDETAEFAARAQMVQDEVHVHEMAARAAAEPAVGWYIRQAEANARKQLAWELETLNIGHPPKGLLLEV